MAISINKEERQVSEQPVGQFIWFILFDAIHYRGQLSAVYFATPDVHQPDGMFYGTAGDALLRKFAVTIDLRNMTIAIDGSH